MTLTVTVTGVLVATPSFATRAKLSVPDVPRTGVYVAVPAVLSIVTVPPVGSVETSTVSESPSESDAERAIVMPTPASVDCEAIDDNVGAALEMKPSG